MFLGNEAAAEEGYQIPPFASFTATVLGIPKY